MRISHGHAELSSCKTGWLARSKNVPARLCVEATHHHVPPPTAASSTRSQSSAREFPKAPCIAKKLEKNAVFYRGLLCKEHQHARTHVEIQVWVCRLASFRARTRGRCLFQSFYQSFYWWWKGEVDEVTDGRLIAQVLKCMFKCACSLISAHPPSLGRHRLSATAVRAKGAWR